MEIVITQAEGDQEGPQKNPHEGNELGKWSRRKKEKVKHFVFHSLEKHV